MKDGRKAAMTASIKQDPKSISFLTPVEVGKSVPIVAGTIIDEEYEQSHWKDNSPTYPAQTRDDVALSYYMDVESLGF